MMDSHRVAGWVVVAVLAAGQSACTRMYPVELAGVGALPAALEVGDRISVLDSSGTTTDLVVTSVGLDFVEGTAGGDRPVRIAAAEMQEVHESKRAAGKTIGLGMGIGFLLFMGTVTAAGYEWY